MMTKHLTQMLLVCGLVILLSVAVKAQTSNVFWIHITDDAFSKDTATLWFGNNDAGTFGVDAALGENSTPPLPPGFSSIFVCPRVPSPADWGIGLLKKDFRDTPVSPARKDSFYVQVRNDGTDSASIYTDVHLSWPDPSYLGLRCDSIKLLIRFDPGLPATGINMASQSSYDVFEPFDPAGWNGVNQFTVKMIKYGDHVPNVDAVRKESSLIPSSFQLQQNYPNPFNPTTTMKFDILKSGMTDISVYNILGQKIATLVSSQMTPGSYSVTWKATDDKGALVTSGMYFVRMNVHTPGQADFSAVRKIMLLK